MRFSTLIIILSIVFWGVLTGGIVYSHIVYFPVFLSNLPESSGLVNGTYALHEENFWMLIHPVLIATLIIAIISNWKNKSRRKNLLISFIIYAVVLVVSALYFIPELIAFSKSATSNVAAEAWHNRAKNWMNYSIIRGIIVFAAIIPLFKALMKNQETTNSY